MSNTIRFQFTKGSTVRFLSHLDLIKTLERAIRRANLPIAYSEGFTPRPKMSFGFPLSVGILSQAEYGDYEMREKVEPAEFIAVYNEHLPSGLKVLAAQSLPAGSYSLQRLINAASYQVVLPDRSPEEMKSRWEWLQDQDSFKVERETKRGKRSLDLLPLLYDVNISEHEKGALLNCFCAVGSAGNLRIDELGALLGFAHLDAVITRTGQYQRAQGGLRTPLEK